MHEHDHRYFQTDEEIYRFFFQLILFFWRRWKFLNHDPPPPFWVVGKPLLGCGLGGFEDAMTLGVRKGSQLGMGRFNLKKK